MRQVEKDYALSLTTGTSAIWLEALVGGAGLGGLKSFQGLDGQRRGSSVTTSTTPGEADGLAAVVSSSEDSSLAKVGSTWLGDAPGGSTFLSGVQPGGRRLLKA